jgi:hypothetical protein
MALRSAKDRGDFKTDPLPSALHRQERALIIIDCHLVVVVLFRLGGHDGEEFERIRAGGCGRYDLVYARSESVVAVCGA